MIRAAFKGDPFMSENENTVPGGSRRRELREALPPGLKITLEVVSGPDLGMKIVVTSRRTMFGRKDADVRLSDPTVSGRHAVLDLVGRKLFLTDLGSTNGTRVKGQLVESSPLANLDDFSLGESRFLVYVSDETLELPASECLDMDTTDARIASEKPVPVQKLPNPALPQNLYVVLEVMEGPGQGKKHKVSNLSTVIGRSKSADFILEDPAVSLRHCQVEIHSKDKMIIKDLASENGTRLNGRYVSAVMIKDGDLVQTGETKIKIMVHLRR